LEELERTVALLAFDDASTCPVKEVKELLDNAQRQKTASELNAAILTSQSHEKGKSLVGFLDCNICHLEYYHQLIVQCIVPYHPFGIL
jgi:hypothetical protein